MPTIKFAGNVVPIHKGVKEPIQIYEPLDLNTALIGLQKLSLPYTINRGSNQMLTRTELIKELALILQKYNTINPSDAARAALILFEKEWLSDKSNKKE